MLAGYAPPRGTISGKLPDSVPTGYGRVMSSGRCSLCGETSVEAAVCAGCERTYGPRVARLLARAERDPSFAQVCLAYLPGPLRARFASLLGQRCLLPGASSALRPGLRPARPRADPKWLRAAN